MIGSSISAPVGLNVGCPQGAILSPTCFMILISDIEEWASHAQLCGYANDTSATVNDEDLSILKQKCEESVNGLLLYLSITYPNAKAINTVCVGSKRRYIYLSCSLEFTIKSDSRQFLTNQYLRIFWEM